MLVRIPARTSAPRAITFMDSTASIALIVFLILLLSSGLAACAELRGRVDPPPPPPTRDQMVGTFLAIQSRTAYRVDLQSDGTGTLAVAWRGAEPRIRRYRTAHWELDGRTLKAKFDAVNADAMPLYLHAEVAWDHSLQDVSLSLSDSARVPIAETFVREARVNEWLDLLSTTPNAGAEHPN